MKRIIPLGIVLSAIGTLTAPVPRGPSMPVRFSTQSQTVPISTTRSS